jgi:pyroglutamyl-peptidase
MRSPRLLVTGFSGFPGAPRNPTEALIAGLDVDRLARRLDVEIGAAVLSTEFAAAGALVVRLWHEVAPDAVIHFGLHGRARAVHVETRAKNHMTPVRPDAAGRRPGWPAIERQGPAIRHATLPVHRIVAALGRRAVPARLSTDAGSYLCNYATYLSLGLAPRGALTGFVHLPWPGEVRAPRAPGGRPDWARLEIAIEEAIRVTAVAARANRRRRGLKGLRKARQSESSPSRGAGRSATMRSPSMTMGLATVGTGLPLASSLRCIPR